MKVDFEKMGGLVPAIVQDAKTDRVLMLGYMNEESLRITQEKGLVTFWSRSRETLWTKGETSGNFLELVDILVDCDSDTLLIKANPKGPVCHTGMDTCFGEDNSSEDTKDFIYFLEDVIEDRHKYPVEGSYTNLLFSRGINKILQKVGEESVEMIIAAKDKDKHAFIGEAADLFYHILVLFEEKGIKFIDVLEELKIRHS